MPHTASAGLCQPQWRLCISQPSLPLFLCILNLIVSLHLDAHAVSSCWNLFLDYVLWGDHETLCSSFHMSWLLFSSCLWCDPCSWVWMLWAGGSGVTRVWWAWPFLFAFPSIPLSLFTNVESSVVDAYLQEGWLFLYDRKQCQEFDEELGHRVEAAMSWGKSSYLVWWRYVFGCPVGCSGEKISF